MCELTSLCCKRLLSHSQLLFPGTRLLRRGRAIRRLPFQLLDTHLELAGLARQLELTFIDARVVEVLAAVAEDVVAVVAFLGGLEDPVTAARWDVRGVEQAAHLDVGALDEEG